MMGTPNDVRISKLLALVLRHEPEKVGLRLDPAGWAGIDDLLAGIADHGMDLSEDDLRRIVAESDKQRYVIDGGRRAIRANQGHSVPVDLGLEPLAPPDQLYHGTATRFLDEILTSGLRPMSRQHVHLSAAADTARKVGSRHGKPCVLTVAAARMAANGSDFYRSLNGVWLTAAVPPVYLSAPETT